MKLLWEKQILASKDSPYYVLWRRDGLRYVARLGTLWHEPGGYVAYSADHLHQQFQPRVCRLPAELTIDEAKDAAKLILAAGRQS
jgi:hypothetical protein